ncbi:hypothetical protein DFP73DRAFT_559376 [Morchella snyderi]|nr:hypothetical protein DFP73DRAFT_559376 [Morchella snyderi]
MIGMCRQASKTKQKNRRKSPLCFGANPGIRETLFVTRSVFHYFCYSTYPESSVRLCRNLYLSIYRVLTDMKSYPAAYYTNPNNWSFPFFFFVPFSCPKMILVAGFCGVFLIYRDEPLSLVAGSNGGFEPFTWLFLEVLQNRLGRPWRASGAGALLKPLLGRRITV